MNGYTIGTVYLLHFERPYKHARHYLGWTLDLPKRLDEHLNGTGGRLLEVITEEGIGFTCVRTWEGMRLRDEKKLKHRQRKLLCPICTPTSGGGQG
jgi:predicted GIY-YIG superfamily endonuclease